MKRNDTQFPEPKAYTLRGFCAAYSVTVSAAYTAMREGQLRTFKIGRRRMVSAEAAREFLAKLEAAA